MLTQSQRERIARRFTAACIRAMDEFPGLIARSEPEAAAAIVADLMKTQLRERGPAADSDDDRALLDLLNAVARDDQQDD